MRWRAGSGEWGGFGGGGSRTVGSTYLEHLQTSKNSTSFSRTPPFLVLKLAPKVGPEADLRHMWGTCERHRVIQYAKLKLGTQQ